MREHSGGCHIVVRRTGDPAAAVEGLRAFSHDLFFSDLFAALDGEFGGDLATPLRYSPSFASEVEVDGDEAGFWFDADDVLETWPELVPDLLGRLKERLGEAGVARGQIGWPKPPYTYDPDADWFHMTSRRLQPSDDHWLPPGFPEDLVIPAGSGIAVAHEALDGGWSHAAWTRRRLGERFTDALDAWREQGMQVEPLPGPPDPPPDLQDPRFEFTWFPADHWFRVARADSEGIAWIHAKEWKKTSYLHLLWYGPPRPPVPRRVVVATWLRRRLAPPS